MEDVQPLINKRTLVFEPDCRTKMCVIQTIIQYDQGKDANRYTTSGLTRAALIAAFSIRHTDNNIYYCD